MAESTAMTELSQSIFRSRYAITPTETWGECSKRVVEAVCGGQVPKDTERAIQDIITAQKFIPAGRYLANAGRSNVFSNCLTMACGDSREEWSQLLHDASLSLMKGVGIGVEYSEVRPNGAPISSGGYASGAVSVMRMLNEVGRHIRCGGARRTALLAQLPWNHQDIWEFISSKRMSREEQERRSNAYTTITPLDMTNISVRLDDAFFKAFAMGDELAFDVYGAVMEGMIEDGEPGFLVNVGEYEADIYTNACSEYRSSKPNSICNLGSINLAAIDTLEEFKEVVELATLFLMCGRERSLLPFPGASKENIGLGLMGLHSWLMQRGYSYSVPPELHKWMFQYKVVSTTTAQDFAAHRGLVPPERVRCVAPSGTISQLTGISGKVATSGIEPLFAKAYLRRWMNGSKVEESVVIDDLALHHPAVEDSYDLSSTLSGIERRLAVVAEIQRYVDMAISVTINLPSDANQRKHEIMSLVAPYLPKLRGLTMYRDGSRGLSPLQHLSVEEALKLRGEVGSTVQECSSGVCGI